MRFVHAENAIDPCSMPYFGNFTTASRFKAKFSLVTSEHSLDCCFHSKEEKNLNIKTDILIKKKKKKSVNRFKIAKIMF